MAALIIPVRLYIAIYLIRRFLAPRRHIAANAMSVGSGVIGAAFLFGTASFAEPFRWMNLKSASTDLNSDIASYMGAQIMNRALPEGSVIGSWDAGVIGYFSRFPVVNLDGLVNSYDHLRAGPTLHRRARSSQQPEALDLYRRYGITHFANSRRRDQTPNNVIFQGAPLDYPYSEYRFTLWTYATAPETHVEIDYSRKIWDSVQSRFDYLSDGVGVVLAGRTAQAFVKDCAQDEPLVWTWLDQRRERILIEPSLYRSGANMCVAQLVLSRGDGQPSQVKIAPLRPYFANLTASREPIIRSEFDVYLIDGSLIYAKSQCGQSDIKERFFANIFPVEADVLPARLRQRGYETLDFSFADYGAIAADGRCWAALSLPNYPIAEIHAGQYATTADGYAHIWEGFYRIDE